MPVLYSEQAADLVNSMEQLAERRSSRRELLAYLLAVPLCAQRRIEPLIDVHHHIVPPRYLDQIGTRNIGGPAGRPTAPNWSPQISLEAMDALGIQTSIVSISAPGFPLKDAKALERLVRESNEFAKQLKTDHPGRFGFFAGMPMPNPRTSVAEAAYALDVLKADGIGLLTSYDGMYLGNAHFTPFFDELNRRKAVAYVHPTPCTCSAGVDLGVPPATAEYPHETTRTITSLLFSGTLNRCPDIRFIFSHAGGTFPFVANRIAGRRDPKVSDGMALVKRLYYDTAQSMNPIAVTALMSFATASQIVFGSDFPFVGRDAVGSGSETLRSLVTDPGSYAKIASENAISLFPGLRA